MAPPGTRQQGSRSIECADEATHIRGDDTWPARHVARAAIVSELEPNNSFAAAQNVNAFFSLDFDPNIGLGPIGSFVNTSTTIPHVTIISGPGQSASPDYYRFTTTSAGTIILDIDSAPQLTNIDTRLFLYNSSTTQLLDADDEGNDPGDLPGLSSAASSILGLNRGYWTRVTTSSS